uniref:Alkylated DNA repair protein AlkB homologue 8 N-terminal domain-containing protein n=1 Tax=Knipowitschia caucasica TaxID=637954 RepID=A0AAV2LXD7_KNICA
MAEGLERPYFENRSGGLSEADAYTGALYYTVSSMATVGFRNSPNTILEMRFIICLMFLEWTSEMIVYRTAAAVRVFESKSPRERFQVVGGCTVHTLTIEAFQTVFDTFPPWTMNINEDLKPDLDCEIYHEDTVYDASMKAIHHDSVKLIKFADDTTLIGLISNNDESAYRREVDRLVSWCSGNNLELNAQKTVEMIVDFRKSTVPPPPPSVMDSPITSVESFRFLGTTITQDLKWEPTISSLIKKAQQRMYFLRQLRKAKLPAQMLVQFYTAIIESILTSSITVWFAGATVRDKQRLQRIVRSAEEVIGRSLPSLQDLKHKFPEDLSRNLRCYATKTRPSQGINHDHVGIKHRALIQDFPKDLNKKIHLYLFRQILGRQLLKRGDTRVKKELALHVSVSTHCHGDIFIHNGGVVQNLHMISSGALQPENGRLLDCGELI